MKKRVAFRINAGYTRRKGRRPVVRGTRNESSRSSPWRKKVRDVRVLLLGLSLLKGQPTTVKKRVKNTNILKTGI